MDQMLLRCRLKVDLHIIMVGMEKVVGINLIILSMDEKHFGRYLVSQILTEIISILNIEITMN